MKAAGKGRRRRVPNRGRMELPRAKIRSANVNIRGADLRRRVVKHGGNGGHRWWASTRRRLGNGAGWRVGLLDQQFASS
ncbi:hypothetical protein TorRG33x02_143540 [Trema orientale]|uniref:Uncharacterized protein n=1 Tax=Trema orientale TaxID=63057 RepID=A0A2P5EWB8_TREOI|nr:hypothetical protein TorRG33x02_143540 [Trema orientale]